MPPAIGMAIAGIASAGAGIYGAKKQSSAAKRADQIAQQSNADQLAYLREQSTEDRRRYDQQQQLQAAHYAAQQAQLAPYINAGAAIARRGMGLSPRPTTIGGYATQAGADARALQSGPMAPPQGGGQRFTPPNRRPVQTGTPMQYGTGTIADFIGRRS